MTVELALILFYTKQFGLRAEKSRTSTTFAVISIQCLILRKNKIFHMNGKVSYLNYGTRILEIAGPGRKHAFFKIESSSDVRSTCTVHRMVDVCIVPLSRLSDI